jgi:hypothetical protein
MLINDAPVGLADGMPAGITRSTASLVPRALRAAAPNAKRIPLPVTAPRVKVATSVPASDRRELAVVCGIA